MTSAPVIRIRAKVPTWTPFERLRKVRRESGLNQNEFAAVLGVKPSTLGAWETGRNPIPDVLTLSETIEREFGYSKYWFRGDLDGDGYDGDGPDGGASVGPTGLEPMTSTVESGRFDNVTPLRIAA